MSTTIDGPSIDGLSIGRRAARFLGAAPARGVDLVCGPRRGHRVAEPTRRVAVFGPAETTLRALTQGDGRLVDGGNGYIIVQGQHAGFVRHLYAGGAWLVLPVVAGGCRGRIAL